MKPDKDRDIASTWGSRLRTWREDVKHWSRNDFKEQVEAASYKLKEPRGHLLTTRHVARWESGAVKRPQGAYLRILSSMGAPLPPPADSMSAPASRGGEDDVDRRLFLRGAGVALAAAATVPHESYRGRAVPAKIDATHVQGLRRRMEELYLRDQQVGGAVLADSALEQYYDARQMLDEADYREEVGRDLMIIAGELAVCVGWLSYDAGDQRKAHELYAEAFLLADQANDPRLAVQAVEKMVLQSASIADRGRHRGAAREATRLSRRAADLARFEDSARLHALLSGRQAIAYAVAPIRQPQRDRRARGEGLPVSGGLGYGSQPVSKQP